MGDDQLERARSSPRSRPVQLLWARVVGASGAIILFLSPWQPWILRTNDGETITGPQYPFRLGDGGGLLCAAGICCLVAGLLLMAMLIAQAASVAMPRWLFGAGGVLAIAASGLGLVSILVQSSFDGLTGGSVTVGRGITMCLVGTFVSVVATAWMSALRDGGWRHPKA